MAERPVVRLGGRTTVTVEEFQRLRAALDRGMNRQQLRAFARTELGRGISNDAIRELRSIRRESRGIAGALRRTAPSKRVGRRIPSVQSTGREYWQVIAVARIEISPTYAIERQIQTNFSRRPRRHDVESRVNEIAANLAVGEIASSGVVRSVTITSIIRYTGGNRR